jgi:hypothetical protein
LPEIKNMKKFCKKLVKYTGKLIKYAILSYLGILAILGVMLFITTTIDKIWPPRPMKEVMAENYELHKEEIIDLTNYFKSITDGGKVKAYIEFSWGSVDRLCAGGDCFSSSDKNKDNLHRIASKLGWNDKTLKTLKKKLKAANCISITNNFLRNGLFDVGFERGWFETYVYTIFDKDLATDLTEEEFKKFTNDCDQSYYKDNIVFSFNAGGTGPNCFINLKKK